MAGAASGPIGGPTAQPDHPTIPSRFPFPELTPFTRPDCIQPTWPRTDDGFGGVDPEVTGRPSYHPSVLLKLYIYGYLNRVQSSRRLKLRHFFHGVTRRGLGSRCATAGQSCAVIGEVVRLVLARLVREVHRKPRLRGSPGRCARRKTGFFENPFFCGPAAVVQHPGFAQLIH
jgi:Transposase domain (DUF772)